MLTPWARVFIYLYLLSFNTLLKRNITRFFRFKLSAAFDVVVCTTFFESAHIMGTTSLTLCITFVLRGDYESNSIRSVTIQVCLSDLQVTLFLPLLTIYIYIFRCFQGTMLWLLNISANPPVTTAWNKIVSLYVIVIDKFAVGHPCQIANFKPTF